MNSSARRRPQGQDTTINDFLNLSEEKRRVLSWMQRQTACSFTTIVSFLNQSEDGVRSLLQELQQEGFVEAIASGGEIKYQVRLTSMRHQRHQHTRPSLFDLLIDDE